MPHAAASAQAHVRSVGFQCNPGATTRRKHLPALGFVIQPASKLNAAISVMLRGVATKGAERSQNTRANVPHVARSRQPNEQQTLLILCHLNEHVKMRLWAKMLICTTVKDLGDRIQRFDYNRRGVVYRFHTHVKKKSDIRKDIHLFYSEKTCNFLWTLQIVWLLFSSRL